MTTISLIAELATLSAGCVVAIAVATCVAVYVELFM